MSNQILVIEDDADIRAILETVLKAEGYTTISTPNGPAGLQQAKRNLPRLVLLDLNLPGMPGLEVCRELKQTETTSEIPILIISGKSLKADIVLGLGVGADDYLTKPFDTSELLARVRAQFRRHQRFLYGLRSESLKLGSLTLDRSRYEAKIDNQLLSLSVAEFKILYALAERPGIILDRNTILTKMYGEGVCVADRAVDVHINAIRKKLGPQSALVQTVRGVGYRVTAPSAEKQNLSLG